MQQASYNKSTSTTLNRAVKSLFTKYNYTHLTASLPEQPG